MLSLAAPIVVWSAIWKIVVASLAGGAGVAIVFGFIILGVERAEGTDEAAVGGRLAWYGLALIAAGFCVFAIVVGVYAMTQK